MNTIAGQNVTDYIRLMVDDKWVELGDAELYISEPGEPTDMDEWLGWYFQQNPVVIQYEPPCITIEGTWESVE